jgi:hypothetical protein
VVVRLLIVPVIALASGCWPGGAQSELRDGARSLLPPGSSVVETVEADCVELARSPSCVHIYYTAETTLLDERVRALEDAAASGEWRRTSKELLPGGASLRFRRGRLEAIVYIWTGERARRCREAPTRDCADVIMVERS